ncbi:MAG: hypothetical protein LWW75_03185 [Chlorobiales bacterium]|nr:hypothetical protein [Chlorobiales bacterium]
MTKTLGPRKGIGVGETSSGRLARQAFAQVHRPDELAVVAEFFDLT